MYIRIGTRPSALALKQVQEILSRLPDVGHEVVTLQTKGDKDKRTPLASLENTDFFTYEIEQALLKGDIDVAVHSAKDLEEDIPEGLTIAALTGSVSPYDSLVSRNLWTLDNLPAGSRIGTSSVSRKMGIEEYRKDLLVKDIRGNVDERIVQLDMGDFEAIVVAHAALIRLGLEERASQILSFDIIKPHPLQGRLAIQVRRDRKDLINIFKVLDEE